MASKSEEQLQQLRQSLYTQANTGNAAMMKLALEQLEAEASQKNLDVYVEIVPFDIPDKRLAAIVAAADISVVSEMLTSLADRLVKDEVPKAICDLLTMFQDQYERWFEVVYSKISA